MWLWSKLNLSSNSILNSKFDKDNQFPVAEFDVNYSMAGPAVNGGNQILTNYYHNSPLFYEASPFNYKTFANRTFHNINYPYDILFLGHNLQPRLMKLFGVGSKFGRADNNSNYLRTITNTTSFSPTDSESWAKYGVEQIVAIPVWAKKVRYGVKYLVRQDDNFRANNFGGLVLYFQKSSSRSYVNTHIIKSPNSSTPISTLESLYTLDTYINFDANFGSNAMCQWLGPATSKVKIKRRSSIVARTISLVSLSDTIDIPTFSTSGGAADGADGFPDYISFQMFFAEWASYLNDSGIPSGSIYFYEPYIYFEA